jgi:hypothetical protein
MGRNKIIEEKTDSSGSDESEFQSSDESSLEKKEGDLNIENPKLFFNQKELAHYKIIDTFFKECHKKNPENVSKMIDIIEGKSSISLRILDWFVTKYSKKRINCNGANKNIDAFDVKISYKAQLKAYKKRYFDPFRRRKKFFYPCTDEGYIIYEDEPKHIYTTLGQLNFFRWAFSHNIVSYVEENLHFVVAEMNIYNKDEKKKKLQLKENNIKKSIAKKILLEPKENTFKTNQSVSNENNEIKFILRFDD